MTLGIFKFSSRSSGDVFGEKNVLVHRRNSSLAVQRSSDRVLFVSGELRVADDVEEEDVGDLKLDLLFHLSGHTIYLDTFATEEISTTLWAVEINNLGS